MATERVKFQVKVFDNFIEVIPEKGVKDNSIYEIKLNGVKDINGVDILSDDIKFATAMTPSYCSIMDVSSLIDIADVPEDIILYNIRESSKYADYIYESYYKGKKINKNKVPFEIKSFVRYKAAKDCMLKIYMAIASNDMLEGMLGEVKFKLRDKTPDIQRVIGQLDKEINKWIDAIKGYHLEGRAKMQTAIKGYHHGGKNPMTQSEKGVTPKGVPISMNRGVF